MKVLLNQIVDTTKAHSPAIDDIKEAIPKFLFPKSSWSKFFKRYWSIILADIITNHVKPPCQLLIPFEYPN